MKGELLGEKSVIVFSFKEQTDFYMGVNNRVRGPQTFFRLGCGLCFLSGLVD